MPIHKIDLKEMQEWKDAQEIMYASCSTKRLYFTLLGNYVIKVKVKDAWYVKHTGMQNFTAMEQYNDLP